MNNWRGCKNIKFQHNGTQSDPDLIYNGYTFNYWDIEDALWNEFLDYSGYKDSDSEDKVVEQKFNEYLWYRAEDYLEDVIFGGYFQDGSKSWHDR